MGKIENTATVNTYEDSKPESIKVSSHWNRKCFVVLQIGQKEVVVDGGNLKKAIDSCMNVGI